MSIKEISNDITTLLGGAGLAMLIGILLCFAFYQLAMRLYYMSVGVPTAQILESNRVMTWAAIVGLTVVISLAGIMAFAKDVLTGIINK